MLIIKYNKVYLYSREYACYYNSGVIKVNFIKSAGKGTVGLIIGSIDILTNYEIIEFCQKAAASIGYSFKVIELSRLDKIAEFQLELKNFLESDCFIIDFTKLNQDEFKVIENLILGSSRPTYVISDGDVTLDLIGVKSNFNIRGGEVSIRKLYISIKNWLLKIDKTNVIGESVFFNPDVVDIGKLDPRAFENLCFELLKRIGINKINWTGNNEADLVGTLQKKDLDGYEYEEMWCVFIGNNAERAISFSGDPGYMDYLLRKVNPRELRWENVGNRQVVFLLISRNNEHAAFLKDRMRRSKFYLGQRIKVWDNESIISLLEKHPALVYKYFVDESYRGSHRKSYEELYNENMMLTDKLHAYVNQLEEEQKKRVLAERDAAWKDVSFKAAHKLGNPIYQADNWACALMPYVLEGDGQEYLLKLRKVLEKANIILGQFKSATKLHQVSLVHWDLQEMCRKIISSYTNDDVKVNTECVDNIIVAIDPDRFEDVLDELIANSRAINASDESLEINITISDPETKNLPKELDKSKKFVSVKVADNGCGIDSEMKEKIFLPFYTTNPHGTGLGLPIVRKIVDAHGGIIREVGKQQEGAVFEIFLPLQDRKPRGN